MKNIIEKEIEDMCPTKSFKVKHYTDPWITREVIEMINDKDRLLKIARSSGNKEDWEVAKRARNFVSGQIRSLKAEFLMEEQRNNADDPKKFWRTISTILPAKKGDRQEIVLTEDGVKCKPEKSADIINSFFYQHRPIPSEGLYT